jgi:hypothetical protein
LTFTPNTDFNGNVSFTWNGYDGTAYADTNAQVSLTVEAIANPEPSPEPSPQRVNPEINPQPSLDNDLFPIPSDRIPQFTNLNIPLSSNNTSNNNTTDSTALPEPPAIPPEPTTDLKNIPSPS